MSSCDSLQAQLEAQKRHSVSHLQSQVACSVTSFYDSLLLKVRSLGSPLGPGDASLTWSGSLQEAIHRDGEYYRSQLGNALTDTFNVNLRELLQLKETTPTTSTCAESRICPLEPGIKPVDEVESKLEILHKDEEFRAGNSKEPTKEGQAPEKVIELIDLVSDDEEEKNDNAVIKTEPELTPSVSTLTNLSVSNLRRSKRKSRKINYGEKMEESDDDAQRITPSSNGWRPILSSETYRKFLSQATTTPSSTQKFLCLTPGCGKAFHHKLALILHRQMVHSSRTDKASDNRQLSAQRETDYLRDRKLKVRNPKESTCDVCGKVFRSKGSLTVHLRSHTGIMSHGCSWPGCTFATTVSSSKVIRHVRRVHFKLPGSKGEQARRGIVDERDASLFCKKLLL